MALPNSSVRLVKSGGSVTISIGLGPQRAVATMTIGEWSELIARPESGPRPPLAFPAPAIATDRELANAFRL